MGERYTIDVNFLQRPNGKFGRTKPMGKELLENDMPEYKSNDKLPKRFKKPKRKQYRDSDK